MNETSKQGTDWGTVALAFAGAIIGLVYMLTLPAVQELIRVFFVAVCLPIGAVWGLIKAIKGLSSWNTERFEKRLKLLQVESELEDKKVERERKQTTALTPVGEIHINDISPQMAQLVALQIDAQRAFAPVPHNYSPHISHTHSVKNDGAVTQAGPQAPNGHTVPTFNDLFGDGQLGNGRMLVGYDSEQQPLWDKLQNMRSILVSGKSGMGKSSGMRFLICQAILNGCSLIVMDPHGNVEDESLLASLNPLSNHYEIAPAVDDDEILDSARYARDQLDKRIKGQQPTDKPLLVVADEMTSIINRGAGDEFAQMIEAIAQEGRKVGVFALCAGQILTAARMGGDSSLRASFPSALVYRTESKQAGCVLPSGCFDGVDTMPTGTAIWSAATGDVQRVIVPNCTADDIQHFSSTNRGAWMGANMGANDHPDPSLKSKDAPTNAPTFAPIERQIIDALKKGTAEYSILKDIFGIDPKSRGADYRNAKANIQSVTVKLAGLV